MGDSMMAGQRYDRLTFIVTPLVLNRPSSLVASMTDTQRHDLQDMRSRPSGHRDSPRRYEPETGTKTARRVDSKATSPQSRNGRALYCRICCAWAPAWNGVTFTERAQLASDGARCSRKDESPCGISGGTGSSTCNMRTRDQCEHAAIRHDVVDVAVDEDARRGIS